MVFYTLVLQLYLKNGPKEKKKMTPFWWKKQKKKKQSYHSDICRWKRDSSSSYYKRNCLNKDIEKGNFKKI